MVTETVRRSRDNQKVKDLQRSVLEAYSKGLLTESQALKQLGIKSERELAWMLDKAGIPSPYREMPSLEENASIADGFAYYWLSRNPED